MRIAVRFLLLRAPRAFAVYLLAVSFSVTALSVTAFGQTSILASQPSSTPTFGITGDWSGLRTRLAGDGLTFTGSIVYDYSKNFAGGISTANYASRELLNLGATLTTDQLLHWQGGTFYVNLLDHEGSDGSKSLTGDAQLFDNQDAPRYVQFYQLWYQQIFGNFRAKIGRIDANTEFAIVNNASAFLNSSYGASPAILALPTIPDAALGANLFWTPIPHFYFGAGAYYSNRSDQSLILSGHPNTVDLTSGGIFSIVELGLKWNLGKTPLPGRIAFGGYDHNGQFKRFDGTAQSGEAGMYAMFDQTLWESSASNSNRSLGIFAQYSLADPHVALMDQHISTGFQWTGPLPFASRSSDILGLGPTWVQFSNQSPTIEKYELAIETFYKLQITPWLDIQPDLQYIINPGGAGRPNALVMTLRGEIDF
jgi:porin